MVKKSKSYNNFTPSRGVLGNTRMLREIIKKSCVSRNKMYFYYTGYYIHIPVRVRTIHRPVYHLNTHTDSYTLSRKYAFELNQPPP